jgi:intracellular septation protein A
VSSVNVEQGKTADAPSKIRTALIRTIAFDLSGPIAAFYALRAFGLGVVEASLLAMLLPLGNAAVLYARRRRLDQVALLTAVVLAASVGTALIGGDQRLILAKDGLITAVGGFWALGTLLARRPLFFSVARPFGEDPGEDWDQLWGVDPVFRHTMTTTTTVWGVGLLLDAVVKVLLAYTLAPDAVPGVSGIQYAVVFGGLALFTVLYVRGRQTKGS